MARRIFSGSASAKYQSNLPLLWSCSKENRQTQANFECVECGYTENADVVGAMNVLARGRAIVQA